MKNALSAILVSFSLAACATTPGTPVKSNNALKDNEFVITDDGGKYHAGTGLYCPANTQNAALTETHVYNKKGTDASCAYKGPDITLTVYLSEYPDLTLNDYFQSSAAAVQQGGLADKVEYDEEASKSCTITTQLMSGLVDILQNSKNNINIDMSGERSLLPMKSAVFSGNSINSYVLISPVDKKFMKLRFTSKSAAENAVTNDCIYLRGFMSSQIEAVGKG